MRLFSIICFLFFSSIVFAQNEYSDFLLSQSSFDKASDIIKSRKSFMRERWFYEQRMFPENEIPGDAYIKAFDQKEALRKKLNSSSNIQFNSLGPTPGYYYSYQNISSRIVTGSYHPTNPDVIFIGTANGGIWKSTNSGVTWLPVSDNEISLSSGCLIIDPVDPEIIYYGTGEATYSGSSYYGAGLLKSTDGGVTWNNYRSGLPNLTYFSRLILKPDNRNILFAALGNSGLYKSTNAGISWQVVLSGRVDDVVVSALGDTLYVIGKGIGIRRSVDGGMTFNAIGTGVPSMSRAHFDYCKSQPKTFYAAVYDSSAVKVFKSTDGCLSWSQVGLGTNFNGSQAWYDLYCRVNPINPNLAYVGIVDVFRTTNGGSTFTNITNGYGSGYVHVDQHFAFFHPSNAATVIFCNDGGIWRSTNNGDSFENLNTNQTLTQFYRIAGSPFEPNRILGGTQDNGTQQTLGTINWKAAFGGDGGEVCFSPFNPNVIIGETQNGGLKRTVDGTNWSSAINGISTTENVAWVAPIIAHPSVEGVFYTARAKVYKTTDNGSSWTAISGNVNVNTAVRELSISKSNPLIMYASSVNLIFRSSDGGVTWSGKTSGLPSKTITSINVHPTKSNVAFLTFSGFGTNKIYKTTNDGTSWFSIFSNLPDSPVNDLLIYPDDPEKTYLAATDVGVFMTRDDGNSWSELYQGLPNTVIMHLDYNKTTKKLRVGTHGRGVFEAILDLNSSINSTLNIADGWNLISIPLLSTQMRKAELFPDAVSDAFYFSQGYLIADTLKNGLGYWIKFNGSTNKVIAGLPVNPLNINVNTGWNLIGVTHNSVQVNSLVTIPSDLLQTSFFEYNNGYQPVTVLSPGRGYWIKVNSNGTITIPNK